MNTYHERISKGLCGLCGKISQIKICEKCKELKRLKYRERTRGLCWKCGTKTSGVLCQECKNKKNVSRKNKRQKLLAEGLCADCGSPSNHKYYCKQCNHRKATLAKNRKDNDSICTRCRKQPVLPNGHCELCYFKLAAKRWLGTMKLWHLLKDKFLVQQGRCAYTKKKLILGFNSQIDHIVARSLGGSGDISNLCWASTEINFFKRGLTYEQFERKLPSIIQRLLAEQ